MTRRIKILHVIHSLGAGDGVAQVVKTIAYHVDQEKFSITICCLAGQGKEAGELESRGIRVFSLKAKSSTSLFDIPQNLYAIYQLVCLIKREKFDILHVHEFFSGTLGRIAAWVAQVPVIILMLHNRDQWKRKTHILIDRWLTNITDKIVANSEAVKNFAVSHENLPVEKFRVIYNGIDIKRFGGINTNGYKLRDQLGIKPKEFVIGTVGRLGEQKGIKYLIEAADIICSRFGEVKFLIVGGDAHHPKESVRDEVFRLTKANNRIKDKVIFTGYRNDVPELISIMDVFVLPSLWEGFGLVLCEAMAMGKPVVATAVDGIPEVVKHCETGILVPPKNSIALAQAIIEFMQNPDKAQKMGEAGLRRCEVYFSADRMGRQYDELYESLLK